MALFNSCRCSMNAARNAPRKAACNSALRLGVLLMLATTLGCGPASKDGKPPAQTKPPLADVPADKSPPKQDVPKLPAVPSKVEPAKVEPTAPVPPPPTAPTPAVDPQVLKYEADARRIEAENKLLEAQAKLDATKAAQAKAKAKADAEEAWSNVRAQATRLRDEAGGFVRDKTELDGIVAAADKDVKAASDPTLEAQWKTQKQKAAELKASADAQIDLRRASELLEASKSAQVDGVKPSADVSKLKAQADGWGSENEKLRGALTSVRILHGEARMVSESKIMEAANARKANGEKILLGGSLSAYGVVPTLTAVDVAALQKAKETSGARAWYLPRAKAVVALVKAEKQDTAKRLVKSFMKELVEPFGTREFDTWWETFSAELEIVVETHPAAFIQNRDELLRLRPGQPELPAGVDNDIRWLSSVDGQASLKLPKKK